MDALIESFITKPYAGAFLVAIGLVCAFLSGWSKAHDFHKLDLSVRFSSGAYVASGLVFLGVLLMIIVNFNNDLGSYRANKNAAVLLFVLPFASIYIIRAIAYRFFKAKYLAEKALTPVDANEAPQEAQKRFCGSCGGAFNQGDRFCATCGKALP